MIISADSVTLHLFQRLSMSLCVCKSRLVTQYKQHIFGLCCFWLLSLFVVLSVSLLFLSYNNHHNLIRITKTTISDYSLFPLINTNAWNADKIAFL